jgi:hypothetical protein
VSLYVSSRTVAYHPGGILTASNEKKTVGSRRVRTIQNWVNAGVYAPCLEKGKVRQMEEKQSGTQRMCRKAEKPRYGQGDARLEIVEAAEVKAGKGGGGRY